MKKQIGKASAVLVLIAIVCSASALAMRQYDAMYHDGARTTAQAIRSPGIIECYNEVLLGKANVVLSPGLPPSPLWSPTSIPVRPEVEPVVTPRSLQAPSEVMDLSTYDPEVLLFYGRTYLYELRDELGASFRGIAPINLSAVPADLKAQYGSDKTYIILPLSCRP